MGEEEARGKSTEKKEVKRTIKMVEKGKGDERKKRQKG